MSRNRCDGLLARVDFPLYTVQTLTNRHILVAGGGGAANTGVANGFEIFELSHNGTKFVAEEVMRYETGPNVVMASDVVTADGKTWLTAGQESHCQQYRVHMRMVDAAEMRRGSFRAENGLVRRRRRTVSENDNISKKYSNSNTTEKRLNFEIRPLDSIQTDFGNDPLQRVVRLSHNGKLMATGGTDGKVRVWSFPTMQLMFELQGHTKETPSKTTVYEAMCTFNIQNFKMRKRNVKSNAFYTDNLAWHINLVPGSTRLPDGQEQRTAGVYVECVRSLGSAWSCAARVDIQLMVEGGEGFRRAFKETYSDKATSHGYRNLLPWSTLCDNYLRGNQLSLSVRVRATVPQ